MRGEIAVVLTMLALVMGPQIGVPVGADASEHSELVPEVCDDLALPNEACLPVRLLNAVLVPIQPDGPIEQRYFEPGPWSVVHEPDFACCDSAGNAYDVFRPGHLGIAGPHPIITWGNGTGAQPEAYDYFLRHVASWGFVVIATREDQTGRGVEILDAARFMVAENQNPSSIFFGRLSTEVVGAMGHSQGAAGAVAAMNLSGGLIATALPLHMPDPHGCGSPPGADAEGCRDLYRNAAGSVFLVSGTFDWPISTPEGNQEYYDLIPEGVEKAKGLLRGTSHADIHGNPGCPGDSLIGCFNGVYGYLGYPVAWMMDRLQGDSFARGAFVSGGQGEIFGNRNWAYQATDSIEAPTSP